MGPYLVCGPKYVLHQHKEELESVLPTLSTFLVKTGKSKLPPSKPNQVILCTPGILASKLEDLVLYGFKLLCFDESHLFKAHNSLRTKKALVLCHAYYNSAKKLLLTATPSPETIGELQPQIEMIDMETPLGRRKEFKNRYERKYDTGSFWKTYYVKQQEIKEHCKPYMFSVPNDRIKLPDQSVYSIKIDMPKALREVYDSFRENCSLYIKSHGLITCTGNMTQKLMQICTGHIIDTRQSKIMEKACVIELNNYKAKYIKDFCKDIDFPVIIWGNYRKELEVLGDTIPDSKILMGGTKGGDQIIRDFKKEKFQFLITNPKCIAEGISLQVAGGQIYSSLNPSCCKYIQSTTRTRRINQKRHVKIWKILYKDSLEEKLDIKLVGKKNKQNYLVRELAYKEILKC